MKNPFQIIQTLIPGKNKIRPFSYSEYLAIQGPWLQMMNDKRGDLGRSDDQYNLHQYVNYLVKLNFDIIALKALLIYADRINAWEYVTKETNRKFCKSCLENTVEIIDWIFFKYLDKHYV